MFIDDMYKDLLLVRKVKLTSAHLEVCKEKLLAGSAAVDVKRIENGYQLFRKFNPDYPENSFRRYCYVRWSDGGVYIEKAEKFFKILGWEIEPEFELIGR